MREAERVRERAIEEVLAQEMVDETRSIVVIINLALLPWGAGQF